MKLIIIFSIALFAIRSVCIAQEVDVDKKFNELTKNITGIPYGKNVAAGRYYDIRGFKIYTEVYGTGQPLLIIHGNGRSMSDFVNQIPYFSKSYKVILADSRAQGKSKDIGDSLSYEMMADDYAALLDAMKIDSAFVIGWSDGGINGLLLTLRHPGKVKKLAITGANLWPDTSAVADDVVQMIQPEYTVFKNKLNKTPREKANWKLMRLLIEEPHISLSALHSINIPVLVIGGDHDVIKPRHTTLIAENIRMSYLWILPNSGHSTPLIYKDIFNKIVGDFFSIPYRKIENVDRIF